MQIPPEISLRRVPRPEALLETIYERADWLERFHPRITSCRVLVEPSHLRHHEGNLFHVRIDVTVPGQEIVVKRDPPEHQAHEDLDVAVHDAFDAVRRRLQDDRRERRWPRHPRMRPARGRVVRVNGFEGFGFIEDEDGHEVYFHRNSVLGGAFERLDVGTRVLFHEEQGNDGPQASTVRVSRRRPAVAH